MGGIWLSRQSLVESLVEIAGYKAGVVVTEEDVVRMVADTTIGVRFLADNREGGRIRSEDLEEAAAQLLYSLGNIPSPSVVSSTIQLYHKYKSDPGKLKTWEGIQKLWTRMVPEMIAATEPNTAIDPSPYMRAVVKKFGMPGLEIAMELMKGVNSDLHRSAWGQIRSVDWKDEANLLELFESEKLETLHGKFFDQRFIDYLNRNFEHIDRINWRKFEGLTGEYFDREGFRVEMGPGRGDQGVDMRIFPSEGVEGAPPLILVQCKRYKNKIDMALVKSVYADVVWENAGSGLIVTTSSLSPGAEHIRTARAYNVEAADRPKLRQWVSAMRSGA